VPAEVISPTHASIQPKLLETGEHASPESSLVRIFSAIDGGNLNLAMTETEALIRQHPNYRLAYLIQGDLLTARTRPLPTFGATGKGSAEQIDDLRAEAIARLRAYRQHATADVVPRYLIRMNERQAHVIVVDTRGSRLYLYRNDANEPRLVADYYMTQGKLGAGKKSEGDRRTPLGVYHITGWIPPEKLPTRYGHGAYPLNYPNEWDRLAGRGGSGIWLHGTPPDTYARPPQASDGCVVLTNPDFDQIGQLVQVGDTPVIITSGIEWVKPAERQREREELERQIEAWRTDWESQDMDRYLAHYSSAFRNRRQDFAAFATQKRLVNQQKTWIKVRLRELAVFRAPVIPTAPNEEVAVVTFTQDYASSNLTQSMKKRQYWQKEEDGWKIRYEGDA
jgi:murein L,D-transpeptidase YafK